MKSILTLILSLTTVSAFALETTQIARCGDFVLEENIGGPQDGSSIKEDVIFYYVKRDKEEGRVYFATRTQYADTVIYTFTVNNSPYSIFKTVEAGELSFKFNGKKCDGKRIYSIYQ